MANAVSFEEIPSSVTRIPPSHKQRWEKLGFALVLIFAVGLLIAGSTGLGVELGWWSAGTLNLHQIHQINAIIMIGVGFLTMLIAGVAAVALKRPSPVKKPPQRVMTASPYFAPPDFVGKCQIEGNHLFGENKWKSILGIEVLDKNIPTIPEEWNDTETCPFSENQLVKTHMLFLIPKMVKIGGEEVRFDWGHFEQNLQQLRPDFKIQYAKALKSLDKEELNLENTDGPYWVLMTRAPIPESVGKKSEEQGPLLEKHDYSFPYALEILIGIVMEYVSTGRLILGWYKEDWNMTCCADSPNNTEVIAIGRTQTTGCIVRLHYQAEAFLDCGSVAVKRFT